MIKTPYGIVAILLLIEAAVLFCDGHPRGHKFFRVVPYVFWIYFLPLLAATLGLIDTASPVLDIISRKLLPASLFLLLLPVDIKAILRLGKPALVMMGAGSLGTVVGTAVAFALFRGMVGSEFWSGFGALAGSWTGGSANMIAVREAVGTPDNVFLPMVVVDTILPYFWMGILVVAVNAQGRFDAGNRSDRKILDELKVRMERRGDCAQQVLRPLPTAGLVVLALAAAAVAQSLAARCPEIPEIISAYAWTIIFISAFGLLLSLTPARKLEQAGASKTGYFLLFFVLTSIGAKAQLGQITTALPLLLAGCVILLIHAGTILLAARLIRAPMFLAAVASQANIGGVASAPIIAEIYQPGFASAGLLLAIFGNIIGTYAGILTAQICRWL